MTKKEDKEIKILFSPEFGQEYNALMKEIEQEQKKGIKNSFNSQLLKAIDRTIEQLKINPQYGIHIPKKLIPKEYIEKYELNNLWKTNLPSYWRMYYTLSTTRLEILTVLITFEDHEEYDKRFKYKKR